MGLFLSIYFYYLVYFCYYLWVSLHILILFMNLTVLFQLTFTFIYSTFNKKFSVLVKQADPKLTLKSQLILPFSLFLLLFMSLTALFGTIHGSYCTFWYYSWVPLHFLVLFMGPILLFQLIFTFIYSTFNKKFSVLA